MRRARKPSVFAALFLIVPSAVAGEFTASYTSVAGCCGEDLNENGVPATRGRAEGRGTQGPFTQDTVLDADFTGIRPATPDECEMPDNSIVIPVVRGSSVVQFRDGSLQFKELAQDGRESFACFDFVAGATTSSIVHWDITGGTQRFEGVRGTSTVVTRILAFLSGLLALEANESGEIQVLE